MRSQKRVRHQDESSSSSPKQQKRNNVAVDNSKSPDQILAEHEHQAHMIRARLSEIETEHLFALNGIVRIGFVEFEFGSEQVCLI